MIRRGGGHSPELPRAVISLERIEEMRRITRSERYLEIGAMARLSRIIELRKFAPGVLVRCLRGIAGPALRNMATIGGNACCRLDSAAALTALDAQYELRGAASSRWVNAARFQPESGPGALGPGEILSRIRVPLDNWDYSAHRKFSDEAPPAAGPSAGRSAVFLAKAQKGALEDIRIICKSGPRIWRDKDGEMLLIGKRLPLTRRMAASLVARWEAFLRGAESVDELSRKELVSFIEANAGQLAE